MANDLLNIKARGLDEVKCILQGFEGKRVVGIVTQAGAEEIVDIMKAQPDETPYQYVSRADAYPDAPYKPGYFSAAQFRFVMARLASGEMSIPYNRTGEISAAWRVDGKLSKARAVNTHEKAPYVFGNESQSRHESAAGWQKVGARLEQYSNQILDAAYAAFREYIDSRRRKA